MAKHFINLIELISVKLIHAHVLVDCLCDRVLQLDVEAHALSSGVLFGYFEGPVVEFAEYAFFARLLDHEDALDPVNYTAEGQAHLVGDHERANLLPIWVVLVVGDEVASEFRIIDEELDGWPDNGFVQGLVLCFERHIALELS